MLRDGLSIDSLLLRMERASFMCCMHVSHSGSRCLMQHVTITNSPEEAPEKTKPKPCVHVRRFCAASSQFGSFYVIIHGHVEFEEHKHLLPLCHVAQSTVFGASSHRRVRSDFFPLHTSSWFDANCADHFENNVLWDLTKRNSTLSRHELLSINCQLVSLPASVQRFLSGSE